jgi:DnaJ domain
VSILSTGKVPTFLPQSIALGYFLSKTMAGKSHFRVRGVRCGKCERIHTWYKYRVWREGKKIKEEYIGKCDQYGNTTFESRGNTHSKQHQEHARQQASWQVNPYRSPYEILGVTYTATKEQITNTYRTLVKKYHPDLNPSIDQKIIAEINAAYHILTH